MLRIVPPTVPRVGRSDEHFPDGLELHLLRKVLNTFEGVASSLDCGAPVFFFIALEPHVERYKSL